LFSTDINLGALEILAFYKSRFQIEFIFRDAKQFTRLADCQSRDLTNLDFHFNSSLMSLNLAKFDAWQHRHLLERFISLLDLDLASIKLHPNFHKLCYYGSISDPVCPYSGV